MTLLVVSFIAGVLTVLAPCILPLLPVVVGSAASGRSRATPYVVVGSLALSVILFTFLLKASTAFIMVPPEFWTYLSGGIITTFGLVLLFPALWERVPGVAALSASSNKLVGQGYQKKSVVGDAIIGAALGPVFSSCSPTYFVILASVLPASFALGTLYLIAYVLGLSLVLLLIALLGQRFADRLTGISDPRSWVKRGVGILFIVLGILIVSGYDKKIQIAILDGGFFDVTKIEQILLEKVPEPAPAEPAVNEEVSAAGEEPSPAAQATEGAPAKKLGTYTEIVSPDGFVNTTGITLAELVGKKVVLVDFLTYSCINCQRTFPYLNAWYEKYREQGLEIVGIHTPEFAFEKDINNVRSAMQKFGITYPIVLDNDYATWNAYGNRYWPRKYLIDIRGNVVYDHIGEGAYEETEMKIRELLAERASALGETARSGGALAAEAMPTVPNEARSPETYFGSLRNTLLANGVPGRLGTQSLALPQTLQTNALYLVGTWDIAPEYAESLGGGEVVYRYFAKEVHLVMEASSPTPVEVWRDGTLVTTITVEDSTLYTLIRDDTAGAHTLTVKAGKGVRLYAFTFG